MEDKDHKTTTPSGNDNHEPPFHKRSCPFTNAHPNATHKKVSGKTEGHKLSESEADNSTHSAVSDEDHRSDGDQRTPSPNGKKTSVKDVGSIGDKSYRSEDETFSDAVTKFSDSGICPGTEERPEGVKGLNTNVQSIDVLKADAIGGISGSLNDNRHTAKMNDAAALESATNQPPADKSFGTKLDRPVDSQLDASLQEINATESVKAKQVQMSSGQPNDLKGIEDINAGEGLVDAVQASVEVSQSVVPDTDEKASNNESAESKPRAEVQHKEIENPNSADLELDFSAAEVKSLDGVNVDKEREQDKQRISTELSPYAPILESKAVSSNEIDGGSQMQLSDSFNAGTDLPALDNPELLKNLNTNVRKDNDGLLKANASGGISVSLNDNRHSVEVNVPESLESATNQPVADKSLGTKLDTPVDLQLDTSPIKSKIPGDASLQKMNATESIEAKQVQMSSGQPNDLKGTEDINARAIVTGSIVHESREESFLEASKDSKLSNDAKAAESSSATGLNSEVDFGVKETTGLLVDAHLNSGVVNNSHAGDVQNEGDDKLINQNNSGLVIPAVDIRAGRFDANRGPLSVPPTPRNVRSFHYWGKSSKLTMERPLIEAPNPLQGPSLEAELLPQPSLLPQPVQVVTGDGVQVPDEIVAASNGCTGFTLIIRKGLNDSDINHNKGRFTLPKNILLQDDFLNDEEKNELNNDELEVKVKVVGGLCYDVSMKIYSSGVSKVPTKVLAGKQWRNLVMESRLEKDDMVEFWKCYGAEGTVFVLRKVSDT